MALTCLRSLERRFSNRNLGEVTTRRRGEGNPLIFRQCLYEIFGQILLLNRCSRTLN
ncbi:MAG: hypothetical protein F6K41_29970 [Symploca sp. SIO3E6]|nr:hypothetical protein [Caldora sp. SIO3E6]